MKDMDLGECTLENDLFTFYFFRVAYIQLYDIVFIVLRF